MGARKKDLTDLRRQWAYVRTERENREREQRRRVYLVRVVCGVAVCGVRCVQCIFAAPLQHTNTVSPSSPSSSGAAWIHLGRITFHRSRCVVFLYILMVSESVVVLQ